MGGLSTAQLAVGGGLIYGRCNPYGAESGGPKRLLGGLYGPNSARTDSPELQLPEAIEQGEWACDQVAAVRVRMTCTHGHTGQVMELCTTHPAVNLRAEFVAGSFRQVKEVISVPGHYEMIQKRQSGFCPPCGWPSNRGQVDYAALQKEWEANGQNLSALYYSPDPRAWYGSLAEHLKRRREEIGALFEEGRKRGIIHNCPLTLVAVS